MYELRFPEDDPLYRRVIEAQHVMQDLVMELLVGKCMSDQPRILPPGWEKYQSSPNDSQTWLWLLVAFLATLALVRWMVWGF
jgi:hypothetical protein